jgi:xanthine/uracil permease
MKLSTLMVVNAVVGLVFGTGFVLAPGESLALYGHTSTPVLDYLAQLLGAALLTFAVLTWAARKAPDSDARRAILLALVVGYAIGFVLALIAQLKGVENTLGWSTVATYFLLSSGFGYFRVVSPAPGSRDDPEIS